MLIGEMAWQFRGGAVFMDKKHVINATDDEFERVSLTLSIDEIEILYEKAQHVKRQAQEEIEDVNQLTLEEVMP